ncbi:MAG TPA: lysophospholipid acyltransferase family protein [Thermomicrobiales bacterium]|nr:lysophospholipid acyltransferase family protein [Thermomicrobiales bacterium]
MKRSGATLLTRMRQRLSGPIQAFQAHFTTGGVRFIGTRLFGFRIEGSGRENVPAGQPLIVAGGPHRNWVDGFLLLVALPPQPRVVFLASENVSDRWWKQVLVRLAGGFEPVLTKSVLNRDALEAALLVLARGDRLGIFPEGWHHLEGPMREIGPFRRGLAFVAQQSGRCVLPVALAGGKPLWRGKTLRVRIGPPLDPPPMDAGKAAQQIWSDELRTTLQELIPPEPPEIPLERRRWPWLTDLFN